MAGEVLVDALPYIDQGYDEAGVRDAALAMVEEECRRYRPTKNYLEYLPPLNMTAFETPLMLHEFERISNRVPMEPLSMKRYELPPPPPGKTSDEPAWHESVDNSKAQLEHQSIRALNLELMLEYGCESWKAHLEIFAALQAKAQLLQQDLKKDVQDANWQRKSKQTLTGERLRSLEAQWVGLVSKNYEIEQACAKLEEIGAAYREQLQQLEQEKAAEELEAQRLRTKTAEEEEPERQPQTSGDSSSEEDSNSADEVAVPMVDDEGDNQQSTEQASAETPVEPSSESKAMAASVQNDEDVEMTDATDDAA